MNLVYEDNNLRVVLQFTKQSLNALLKLSSVLCSSYDGRHVQTQYSLVEKQGRGVVLGNHLCQSFGNSTLAHTRFADKNRIVLLSSAQDFRHSCHLYSTSYDGIELTFLGSSRKVRRELVQHGCGRTACSSTTIT